MLDTMTFLLGFGIILASFIYLVSRVQSGRLAINHVLIAQVTIAGFVIPPFGVATVMMVAVLSPLLLIGLACPIASLFFRVWLDKNPDIQLFTTMINVLIILLIVVFDIYTLSQGKITPDIRM